MSETPASPTDHAAERRRELACLGVVVLITVVAYLPSFKAAFQFDDYAVMDAKRAGQFETFRGFLEYARARLLPFATLAVNYWIGGRHPVGYHLANLIIHVLTTFVVFRLALAVCDTARVRDTWLAEQRLPFAVATAAFFACHPLQVQAVTYIVQRAAAMAALFYVGAVLMYVRARNAQLGTVADRPSTAYAACVVLALAAFLCKENAASLPLAIVLAEWACVGGREAARQTMRLLPFGLLVLVIPLLWQLLATGPGVPEGGSMLDRIGALPNFLLLRANRAGDVSPLDYFLTQAVVVPRYLRLVVLPWGFNVDHDVAVQRSISASVVGGWLMLAALLALGVALLRRWPVAGFGILWVFVALSVESTLLPIRDVMAEHRMYLAMPGIALVAGTAFAATYRRWRTPALVAATAAVVALAALTFLRNQVWQTPVSLWSDAVAKSPRKPRVHINLGMALALAGRTDESITSYCHALALDPQNERALANLDEVVEVQANAKLDAGDEIAFEQVIEATDGSVQLTAPDPCRGR
jgi:hypothetical protein